MEAGGMFRLHLFQQFAKLEFDKHEFRNIGGFIMSGATVRMTSKKQNTLQAIYEKIHYIEGTEQISKSESVINGVTIWTLAYEKYFFRTGSYASLTVVLTEFEEEQTALIVAAGGGEGIVNISHGANRDLANACVLSLEECGFTVTDIEIQRKGLLKRLFK